MVEHRHPAAVIAHPAQDLLGEIVQQCLSIELALQEEPVVDLQRLSHPIRRPAQELADFAGNPSAQLHEFCVALGVCITVLQYRGGDIFPSGGFHLLAAGQHYRHRPCPLTPGSR